jgi:hypothetical protein
MSGLRLAIVGIPADVHFASSATAERSDRKTRKQERDAARRLAALNGAAADAR